MVWAGGSRDPGSSMTAPSSLLQGALATTLDSSDSPARPRPTHRRADLAERACRKCELAPKCSEPEARGPRRHASQGAFGSWRG
eukprot:2833895-Alexandrium_andersonii.AAC.1